MERSYGSKSNIPKCALPYPQVINEIKPRWPPDHVTYMQLPVMETRTKNKIVLPNIVALL